MSLSPAFREGLEPLLLAIADDELVIGHRHSEWTGLAPHIEEDIAFSSIAQDEIGHAAALYKLVSEINGSTEDEIALGRQPGDYTHAILCERANKDWAFTLARQFLYDSADRVRLESLKRSAYKPLADLAEKLLREERYHQLHADAWFRRVVGGPLEGRHQFTVALSEVLLYAVGLFEPVEGEMPALEYGIMIRSSEELLQDWLTEAMGRIEEAGLPLTLTSEDEGGEFVPTSAGELIEEPHAEAERPPSIRRANGRWVLEGAFPGMGGRRGKHSEEFSELWEDLTKTYREEPTATW